LEAVIRKQQGTLFKFDGRWLSTNNPLFLLRNQTIDNLIWTFASAVPLWTAYEVVTLWAFANHYITYVGFDEHPYYFVILMLLVPLWRDLHFYLVHRILHWPPLYRLAHKLHHKNANPGPWSGLAMHPVEQVLYFSCVLIHWIVSSNPLHAVFNLIHASLSPAPGHIGFDKIVVGRGHAVDTHSYAHYLHHKYYECNYAYRVVPLDRWFGTFHNGSHEAQEAMDRRFRERTQRAGGFTSGFATRMSARRSRYGGTACRPDTRSAKAHRSQVLSLDAQCPDR
jgi:sterol desaturase/sphingolipid hydroxylase (fatty acid hydroxylase superfamily)